MYEMQGPHVAGQRADLPIPRLARALPGQPPRPQPLYGARSPGFRTTLGVAPAGDCRSGGEGILTGSTTASARAFVNLFQLLSLSTECRLLSPHGGACPPDIHTDMHSDTHNPKGAGTGCATGVTVGCQTSTSSLWRA